MCISVAKMIKSSGNHNLSVFPGKQRPFHLLGDSVKDCNESPLK